MADYTVFPAIALTGGTDGALDAYSAAGLSDKDLAIVVTATGFYHYILDATSGAAESSPDVIKPDDATGTTADYRWILKNVIDNHTHDSRYYTETEIGTWRNSVTQTEMGYLHGVTSDVQTQLTASLLRDGTRSITGNITQADGLYIATDEVRARDSGGLVLKDDSGTLGIQVEDGGVARLQDSQISSNRFRINSYGSGNRYAYLDFVGDDTYTEFGFRIIRWDAGANTNTDLTHRGTGTLYIKTQDAAPLVFQTSNTTRLTLALDGNITQEDGLYIATDEVRARDSGGLALKDDSGTLGVHVEDGGQVGIGTNSPAVALDINSDILRLRTAKTPATAGAAGNQGDICWDADYIYVCTAASTWERAAIATW